MCEFVCLLLKSYTGYTGNIVLFSSKDLVSYAEFLHRLDIRLLILCSQSASNIVVMHQCLLMKLIVCHYYWCSSERSSRCLIFTDSFYLKPFVSLACVYCKFSFGVGCLNCEL